MTRMLSKTILTLIAALGLPMAAGADAMRYIVTDLGTLPGSNYSHARGLTTDGSGIVVGRPGGASFISYERDKALGKLSDNPTVSSINGNAASDSPGFTSAGVNINGQVVGSATEGYGFPQAAIRVDGLVTKIPTPSDFNLGLSNTIGAKLLPRCML